MTPTLLIFLKEPVEGQVKTRLAKDAGNAEAVCVYKLLVEHQLKNLPDDWTVEIHYAGNEATMRAWLGDSYSYFPQSEGGLGERLSHAYEEAFNRGAKSVFAIGGDCPYLDAYYLENALKSLSSHQVCFGPAVDGGYVLVGMSDYNPICFQDIEWSTERVLAKSLQRCEQAGLNVALLPELEDVDDLQSWQRAQITFNF